MSHLSLVSSKLLVGLTLLASPPSFTADSALARNEAPTAPPSTTPATAATGQRIQAVINDAHRKFASNQEGKNADYIPVLKAVDPKLFGIVVATVDGQVFQVGDAAHPFSIQSVAKVFTLSLLMQQIGADGVEKKIGVNATGLPFNSIIAIENDPKHLPGNPLVNPGAITAVSLLNAPSAEAKWESIIKTYSAFAGRELTVDQPVYKSESETNTRNRAIATLLKAYEVLKGDPNEALDIYTRECSVSVTARDLAIMGATLANGGVNPMTGQRVMDEKNVPGVLAVMSTAGLYENSGEWSFNVGLPAKSGVGGGIVAIVPGKFAIGTFSPPLDDAGNSVRGQKAVEYISKALGVDLYQPHAQPPRQARTPSRH